MKIILKEQEIKIIELTCQKSYYIKWGPETKLILVKKKKSQQNFGKFNTFKTGSGGVQRRTYLQLSFILTVTFVLHHEAVFTEQIKEPVVSKLHQSKSRNASKSGFPSEARFFRRKKDQQ